MLKISLFQTVKKKLNGFIENLNKTLNKFREFLKILEKLTKNS